MEGSSFKHGRSHTPAGILTLQLSNEFSIITSITILPKGEPSAVTSIKTRGRAIIVRSLIHQSLYEEARQNDGASIVDAGRKLKGS